MIMTHILRSSAAMALVAGFLAVESSPAQACPSDPYMGTICYTAATFCPQGWLPANGASVKVNDNQMLYALIGTTYGGDSTSFNLPDLRSRSVVGAGQSAPLANVPLGKQRGTETAALPTGAHTHTATFTPTGPVSNSLAISFSMQAANPSAPDVVNNSTVPNNSFPVLSGTPSTGGFAGSIWTSALNGPQALKGITVTNTGGGGAAMTGGAVTVAAAGTSTPMNILPPQLGLTACIATMGLYPMRP